MESKLSIKVYEAAKEKLLAGLLKITENITEVALAYVKAIDEIPDFRERIAEEAPGVTRDFWRSLERVGRGQSDGRTLVGGIPFSHKIKYFPMDQQVKAIEKPLKLLVGGGDTLEVRIDSMTKCQADQIFAADHIRSPEEQRAWIEAERMTTRKKPIPVADIRIDRKRRELIVGNIRISASDLSDYLRKILE